MKITAIRFFKILVLATLIAGIGTRDACAQSQKQVVFHVLHAEENAIYIDAGRNLGLHEGTTLDLYHPQSNAGTSSTSAPADTPPIAEVKVVIVADSSAVCEIITSPDAVRIGDVGFITPESNPQRSADNGLIQAEDHPISMGFSNGDPRDDEPRPAAAATAALPRQGHTGVRIGVDYDSTQVQGGFRASEAGFQVSSDMTKIAGTNWNFTGYWRSRFRQTYSGFNGAQLESIGNLLDRTYHIGLYYDSPTSPVIAGFGRLSVPGAPSLPTIDGGYGGLKITRHITLGAFGGSTPDPADWDYNPSQRIAGIFTRFEGGNFSNLHFGGTEGFALTAQQWHLAREFAFFENTISWKRYLWFDNSTQVDAARTSPVPGAGSNGSGISFTSSSLRFQPLDRLSFGLNHSYINSLPSFDPNLLGTTLLDKYIFQGISFDVRYEFPYQIGLQTQVGRSKSIADSKQMWNKMFGISLGKIFNTGFHADVRYSQFDSTFGRGNYREVSISRSLKESFQVQLLGGSQSLVSSSTLNTSSHFLTGSVMWSLGPRYFFETEYTWSRGISLNYQQWNTMFGYRFGSFRGR